ncbi:MAG: cell division protein FtsX, partial [Pseudomonadota bacterium]
DAFIANEVQRRFVVLALRGSIGGLIAAIATIGLAALSARDGGGGAFFLPGFSLSGWVIAALAVVPIAVCLATAMSARLTVLRTLRAAY